MIRTTFANAAKSRMMFKAAKAPFASMSALPRTFTSFAPASSSSSLFQTPPTSTSLFNNSKKLFHNNTFNLKAAEVPTTTTMADTPKEELVVEKVWADLTPKEKAVQGLACSVGFWFLGFGIVGTLFLYNVFLNGETKFILAFIVIGINVLFF